MSLAPLSDQRPSGPGRSGLISFVLAIILSVVLISVWAGDDGNGLLRRAQSSFMSAISPLTHLGTVVTQPGRNASTALSDAAAGESRSQLAAENEQLRSQVAELEEYRTENDRLTALLNLRDLYGLDTVTARVIGQSDDTYSRTVTIDQGTDDGVQVGMPVMSVSGLAGQVVSAGKGSAQVRLITDSQSGVSAMLQGSRATGVLSGSSDGRLRLLYVSRATEVSVGDVVITSGLGGIFPKGLVIGTVVSVSGADTATDHTILVQPVTTVSSLEEVLVITGASAEVETPTVEQLQEATSMAGTTDPAAAALAASAASTASTTSAASTAPAAQAAGTSGGGGQ